MHHKKVSDATTARSQEAPVPSSGVEAGLIEQNRALRLETQSLRQQLGHTKREMLNIYNQNLELKGLILKSRDANFMRECDEEMKRLKMLVQDLTQAKSIGASEREEIKDRIIMKLEDELISVKIQLKQLKYKSFE